MAGMKTEYEEPASRTRSRQVTSEWIADIKRSYQGRVIRRTSDSRTHDGKKINDALAPYEMIMVPVHLDDSEMKIITEVMDRITGS
jgi:hypothetical protein